MMRFALIIGIWCLALLTILLLSDEHSPQNAGAPLVKSAFAQPVVIPWEMNTRCTITDDNLPKHDPLETI